MIWALVQQAGGQAGSYVVFIVLAALLSPENLGVVGMATVWTGILGAFAELGFGAAIVQRAELRPEHLSTTFAINLGAGALLTLAGIALAPAAAAFFDTPQVGPVMASLSLGFLIRSWSLTQVALAQRHLRFRTLAVRDIGASVAGGVAGVAAALLGWGVWSLVAMTLVNYTAGAVLIWRSTDWRPRQGEVSWTCARELWPYSSQMFGFSVLKALVQNSDRLVLGYLLGAAPLGVYTFASRVIVFPVRLVAGAFGTYLFPKAARLQSDLAAVRRHYVENMAVLLTLVMPMTVAAALLAPSLVPPIFGSEWTVAVLPIQVLSVTALAGAFYPAVGELAKALGRPQWMLRWSALYTVVLCVALWFGARAGLVGTVVASAAAHVALVPVALSFADRVIRLRWWDLLAEWWPGVAASLVLAAVIWGTTAVSPFGPFPSGWVALGLGILAYVAVLAGLDPRVGHMLTKRVGPTRPASVDGGLE
jgi:O-antigen/teichoic acid export membrane protein